MERDADIVKRRILIVSSEAAPPDSTSPAAACWRLAEELCRSHDVILALPAKTSYGHDDFVVLYYNDRNIGLIAGGCDMVFCDEAVLKANPALAATELPVIASLEMPPGGLTLPPPAKRSKGPLYYWKRFGYHMRTSGLRSMLVYGIIKSKNKLTGRLRRR